MSPDTIAEMDHWKALEMLALIRSTTATALLPEFTLVGRARPHHALNQRRAS